VVKHALCRQPNYCAFFAKTGADMDYPNIGNNPRLGTQEIRKGGWQFRAGAQKGEKDNDKEND